MKNKKVLLVVFAIILLLVLIGGTCYAHLKNKTNSEEEKNTDPIKTNDEVSINLGKIVNNINAISNVFISDEFDMTDSYTDEVINIVYYRYIGEDADSIMGKLASTFIDGLNNEFFIEIEDKENKKMNLYVSKPSNCTAVEELSVNDFSYDEEMIENDYIDLMINKDNGAYEFKTIFKKDVDNRFRIIGPFDTCKR